MKHFSPIGRLAALTVASARTQKLPAELVDLGLTQLATEARLMGVAITAAITEHVKASSGRASDEERVS